MSAVVPEAVPAKKKCVVCDSEIPRDEKVCCPVCLSEPDGKKCVNCGKRIPSKAKLCSICKTYHRWWRFFADFGAALPMVAIIALGTSVYTAGNYLYNRNSHTNFKFVSANANVVYLTVWNAGQKPSALLGGRLNFGDLPIDDVQLNLPEVDLEEAKTVVQKDDRATVALTVPPFLGLRHGSHVYRKDEIQQLLKGRRVTLYLNVDESTGDVASPHNSFAADRIQTFIVGRMYR